MRLKVIHVGLWKPSEDLEVIAKLLSITSPEVVRSNITGILYVPVQDPCFTVCGIAALVVRTCQLCGSIRVQCASSLLSFGISQPRLERRSLFKWRLRAGKM